MKRFLMMCLALFISFGLVAAPIAADDDGFTPIFNGENLDGWSGNEKLWKVEDGAITGQTTKENPTKGNTFIIWRQGQLDDFELKLKYKIIGGNSGIQYRSTDLGNHVVGGYQADFEAGDTWSGAHYHERGRGILAKRGEKAEIGADGKRKVLETLGASPDLQAKIKKEDWNDYHIIARGNEFIHKINDTVMSHVIDNHKAGFRQSGILALQLHAGPPMKVQFKDIRLKRTPIKGKKKVVFLAGRDSHGFGAHEHRAGCTLLAVALNENHPGVHAAVYTGGWPTDPTALDNADAIVMYADGGGRHPVIPHLEKVEALNKKGVGVVCIHYGVEVPKGKAGDAFLNWTGGYFETHWSVNPHWTAKFASFPDHAIASGVKPFEINDEWYYHMRFREGMKGVTPILSDLPGPDTLKRGDGAHSGNPHVRAAVLERKEKQHVAWASEQKGRGRGFGFTGGHNHWNWGDDNFRKLVLNAITWCAGADVPSGGVESKSLARPQLEAFIRSTTKSAARPAAPKTVKPIALKKGVKPKFTSKTVTTSTPGHALEIDVDIKGAKQLSLVVTDGGNGFACDWADWAEPRLVGPAGEKKLTELKWKFASAAFGQAHVNGNAQGKPLRIDGKSVPYGIGTHANSVIIYDLPPGYERFKARGGLDNGGTDQGTCGGQASVQFVVYTEAVKASAIISSAGGGGDGARDPEVAVENLDVHDGLDASLFASEPMMLNPSNIEIDHRGRIWVCEIVNYRGHRNKRPEGDRILILEDKNGDAKADEVKVFYQGRDIDSPHGICVLPTPSGKGLRAIVSAGANVIVLTDTDGDDKADKKELLFTGISGTQHDHGIHAFVFGPDGKLYFNFGNSGNQIKDKDGKPIVDMAGNEVKASRQPYQQGMVFRCNMDGSEFETLGWNFRNNWMATVDSFGTIWQSDNDDDGNRGVRINFVMEFGNYGYRDELTGAGWNKQRTNWEKEIPLRHWHLNDPGVVPNLLQTGQGSPTGITVYEGDALPKVFQGQVLHCDAGPSVCRAYPVTNDGAGYKAETVNILQGARDKWFRPADVSVAPDGSLICADWYDPGVGGHRAGEINTGRLFHVTAKGGGGKYTVPKFDFSTPAGAVAALKNPNYTVRYMAWTALHEMGAKAEPELVKLWGSDNSRYRARALWLLAKTDGRAEHYVSAAIKDKDPNIRIVGIRLARQLGKAGVSVIQVAKQLVRDESPQVRREIAIAIRHNKSADVPVLWAELASQHDGKDRWYLEALGISADKRWEECFAAWTKKVGESGWKTPAGKDIVWRSRSKATPALLAQIIKSSPEAEHPRYYRALDFHSGPEKDKALQSILTP
jgi:putative membrane-bound dehydrogenase-like protein